MGQRRVPESEAMGWKLWDMSESQKLRTCRGVSIPDLELQLELEDQSPRAGLGVLHPCLEFYVCLDNYNLMGCQDVVLDFWGRELVSQSLTRTPELRHWQGTPQTLVQAREVGLGSGVGLDCQTDARAHTPPSKAPLPPEQRKASF